MNGRAFVFTGVRQPFEAREFPLPEVEPDGILVRVTVANICGSDLHGWHGRTPRSGPTIMGHEMTGRIARLGARVTTGRPPERRSARAIVSSTRTSTRAGSAISAAPAILITAAPGASEPAGRGATRRPHFHGRVRRLLLPPARPLRAPHA